MSIAEQLTDKILDMTINAGVGTDTTFEALKITIGVVASFVAVSLKQSDPAIDARMNDVTRAITDLQEEIARVLDNERREETK